MEEAKDLLKTCGPEVDVILARDPDVGQSALVETLPQTTTVSHGPVERRRRRKLPPIERPRSAPIHNIPLANDYQMQMQQTNSGSVHDLMAGDPNAGLKTVIKIGTNSQSIEHHHHHIHHLGNGACVDNTPFMTPAQSVENFYNYNDTDQDQDLLDDEAISVAGTEYSEAPSVARSYTINHNNQVKNIFFCCGAILYLGRSFLHQLSSHLESHLNCYFF
jgi:hypothetical protein